MPKGENRVAFQVAGWGAISAMKGGLFRIAERSYRLRSHYVISDSLAMVTALAAVLSLVVARSVRVSNAPSNHDIVLVSHLPPHCLLVNLLNRPWPKVKGGAKLCKKRDSVVR